MKYRLGFPCDLDAAETQALEKVFDDLDEQCSGLMDAEAKDVENVEVIHAADICYVGQSHYLDIVVDMSDANVRDSIYRDFIRAHEQVFGYSTESPARIVNLRSVHRARSDEAELQRCLNRSTKTH
ncbi:MAG: hypothetical protein CM1200mP41_20900 [Gammaproteobacteria bacterium]|nr:MAG: hypothetical protein CM1200mP41_20900 [Gammaproteobacteria bacterium]